MNKSAGVLLGIVVAIGAISVGGAWYTGTKLEGALQTAVGDANQQLRAAMFGSNSTASLELVSLDRQLFSSTAHYRLKGQGEVFGEHAAGVELLFTDRIEHGPLLFSRLVTLKWLPVMATSHYTLEKTPFTEKWFAATKDVSPIKGVVNIGYDRATSGTLELVPMDTSLDDQSTLKFSGLKLEVSASAGAQKVKANGYMDSLVLTTVAADQSPVKVELNGLTLANNLSKSSFDYYLGDSTVEVANAKTTFGDKQEVLNFKKLEMKTATSESGTTAAVRADYRIAEISLNDKNIGSAKMAWSMKNLDIPPTLALVQLYQTKLQPYEKAAAAAEAAGQPLPELSLTEAEEAQVKANLEKLLAAQPQIALENLSFTTSNGESKASLVVDLAKPQSLDLPVDQLMLQLIALLDLNVQVSKPMITDLVSLQALAEGQTDAKAIAEQALATSDMVSSMAVGTQLATLQGDNIVSKLHYANNQVDFNGQKMTVEEFVGFVLSKLGTQEVEQ